MKPGKPKLPNLEALSSTYSIRPPQPLVLVFPSALPNPDPPARVVRCVVLSPGYVVDADHGYSSPDIGSCLLQPQTTVLHSRQGLSCNLLQIRQLPVWPHPKLRSSHVRVQPIHPIRFNIGLITSVYQYLFFGGEPY